MWPTRPGLPQSAKVPVSLDTGAVSSMLLLMKLPIQISSHLNHALGRPPPPSSTVTPALD